MKSVKTFQTPFAWRDTWRRPPSPRPIHRSALPPPQCL